MDATPDTFQYAERVQRTYENAGGNQVNNVKIMVILHEPVARELSLYNHLAFDYKRSSDTEKTSWHRQVARDDGSIMTFDEFVQLRSLSALGRESGPGRSTRHGLYAKHLRDWFEAFDRQRQILVLSYEELQLQPEKAQERIQQFLGVAIPGKLTRSNSSDNPHKVSLPSFEAKEALMGIFAQQNEALYELLEHNPGPPMEQRPFPRFK